MDFLSNQPEYSVSEIAGQVKRVVEDAFGHVRIRGEISAAKVNSASGHCYLTLKDDKAVLDAVCWKGVMGKLTHKPQAGMEVIATGKLTTYPGSSKYQLVIESLEPAGVGALMAMLEARKKMLEAEGLFDAARKRPLPYLPEVIGIITSPTGAVIRDMLHRLADRFPRSVLLWPVAVQGQGAAEQVAAAIHGFNHLPEGLPTPDLLMVARGGGSIEDLWAFNEEIVVRAVAASRIPIISAIGHETDTTLIDYAADRRAPTPTAAAEMAVPVRAELRAMLEMSGARIAGAVEKRLAHAGERVEGLARGLPRPQQIVGSMEQRLDHASERLRTAMLSQLAHTQARVEGLGRGLISPQQQLASMEAQLRTQGERLEAMGPRMVQRKAELLEIWAARLTPRLPLAGIEKAHGRVEQLAALLESLNVLAVLKRGFALVQSAEGKVISSAAQWREGEAVTVRFHDGVRSTMAGEGGVAPVSPRSRPAPKKPKPASDAVPQANLFDL